MSRSVVEAAALEARSQKLAEQDADVRKALDPRDGKPFDAAAVRRATESLAQARTLLLVDYQAALVELRRQVDEGRDQDRRDLEAVIEMRQKAVESSARAQATAVLLRKTEERLMKALSALSDIRAAEASASLADRKRQHGSFSPRLRPRRSKAASRANPLFDPEYYLAEYPDVRASSKDPFHHFLEFGAIEGRKPNRMFDSKWYLEQNPDVKAAGVNPLSHYYSNGSRERRDPHPLFLTEWYLRQNPGLSESGADPLAHYLAQKGPRAVGRT